MKRTGMLTVLIVILILTASHTFFANSSRVTPLQHLYVMKELIPGVQTVGILWNEQFVDTESVLPKLKRASLQIGLKLVVSNITRLKDVASEFKNLTETHKVDVLWIVENDDVLGSKIGREFLIKQALLANIPLFAPNQNWVSEGACVNIFKNGNKTSLFVNRKTAQVLSLTIPEKYLPNTQFYAAQLK